MVFSKKKNLEYFLLIGGITWLFVVCIGLWMLFQYENFPGTSGNPPNMWPKNSVVKLSSTLPTLIIFAHPKCPCTRATIDELTQIITKCKDKVKTYVVFYKPHRYLVKWTKSDTWYKASNIPGVVPIIDDGGREIRRFHAYTSGQALLYNTKGELLFSGGITGARGHQGNNSGREAVISLLETGKAHMKETFVFGCPILNKKQ